MTITDAQNFCRTKGMELMSPNTIEDRESLAATGELTCKQNNVLIPPRQYHSSAGNSFVLTAMYNFEHDPGQFFPYHADGVTPYDLSNGFFFEYNSGSKCNGFWLNCSPFSAYMDDASCNSQLQFACEGRCYPDGESKWKSTSSI